MTFPIMLFAAGFGTRMGVLTKDRPKPLINVAGKALIDHALDLVIEARAKPAVVNVHYKAEMLETHLTGRDVQIVHETPDILETGGGLRNAMPVLGDGPVMTLNSDAMWQGPNPLTLLAEAWDPARMDALLLCVPIRQTRGYSGQGDFELQDDGQIVRGPGVVYTGAQIMTTARLANVKEAAFSLNVVWNAMHGDGRLFGLSYPGLWCDVGHPEGIGIAEDMLADV